MNGLILAQVWIDNQPVYFMTTLHRPVHEIDNHKIRTLGKEKVKRMALTFLALLTQQLSTISNDTDVVRSKNTGIHKPNVQETPKYCKFCSLKIWKQYDNNSQKRHASGIRYSHIHCSTCEVHLCLGNKLNCWNSWRFSKWIYTF